MYRAFPLSVSSWALLGVVATSMFCSADEVGEFCFTSGPPCGLSVDFDGGDLELGTYAITIETPAGVTTCDYEVRAPVHQTSAEAEKQDEALVLCGENDTCPEPCSGPDTVTLHRDGVRVDGDPAEVTITEENLGTGARAEQTFTPSYSDHPDECWACVTASETMPSPAP